MKLILLKYLLLLIAYLLLPPGANTQSNIKQPICELTIFSSAENSRDQNSNRKEIRHFVITNYRPLVSEILQGEGSYLEALSQLMNLKLEHIPLLSNYSQCLLNNRLSIPDFARSIAEAK